MRAPLRALRRTNLLLLGVAVMLSISVWQTIRLARNNDALRDTLAKGSASVHPGPQFGGSGQFTEFSKAQAELADERARLRSAEANIEELSTALSIAPAEELKALGRIEELASEAVEFLKGLDELPKAAESKETEGDRVDANRIVVDLAGWLVKMEAIGQLEADPNEIAELHAHALRKMLGLDDDTSSRVQIRMVAEFEVLRSHGVDRSQRPTDSQDVWHDRRDRMLADAATRIEALIPVQKRRPNVIAQVLALGSGFRTRAVQEPENGVHGIELYFQAPGLPPLRL